MKFSTAISLAAAPLVAAKRARNVYPPADVVARSSNAMAGLDARGMSIIKGMEGNSITIKSDGPTEVIIIWANPGNGASNIPINPKANADHMGMAGQDTATPTMNGVQTPTAPACATHTVKVGGPDGLKYQPDQLNNVPVGDVIVFEFFAQNHTVTQSSFAAPCEPLAGGMKSGFVPNPNGTVSPPPRVAMQVMTTTPLWFYCAQKGHCGKGMVFSVNPTANKTQDMFQKAAMAQNGTAPGTAPSEYATASAQNPQQTGSPGMGVTPGQGTIGADGSCQCVVACSAAAFPAPAAQGVGAYGGMSGSLPMNMAAMK